MGESGHPREMMNGSRYVAGWFLVVVSHIWVFCPRAPRPQLFPWLRYSYSMWRSSVSFTLRHFFHQSTTRVNMGRGCCVMLLSVWGQSARDGGLPGL